MSDCLCPKCNSVVEAGRYCSHCAAPLLKYHLSRKEGFTLAACILVGMFLILVFVSVFNGGKAGSANNANRTVQEYLDREKAAKSKPPVELTPAELIGWAASLLKSKATTSDELYSATNDLMKIPATAPEYKQAQHLITQIDSKKKTVAIAEIEYDRKELEANYLQTISAANTHLNFITSKTTKAKNGYAIFAIHPYFSSYSLSIGSDAKVIQAWISANYSKLKASKITQVGLRGSGSYSSSSWLNVE